MSNETDSIESSPGFEDHRTPKAPLLYLKQAALALKKSSLDFLTPPACSICGTSLAEPFSQASALSRLCGQCTEDFPAPITNPCSRCYAEIGPYINTDKGCGHCSRTSFQFSSVTAYGMYRDQFSTLCHTCKLPERQSLTWAICEKFWARHADRLQNFHCNVIIAVPRHWRSRLQQRIHPTETIAEYFSQHLQIPNWTGALKLNRMLQKQSSLSPSARVQNVKDAYSASWWHRFSGKHVLLVDDILTTGATAQACTKQLLHAGCESVHVLVLARAIGN